jgi:predicted metal-binding membrane protein
VPDRSVAAGAAGRQRLVISLCLAAITALAWAYLIRLARQMSASMEYDTAMAAMGMTMQASWSALDVWLTFVMWLVMMIGMMTPSAAPLVLLFASTAASRRDRGISVSTATFALGYLAVWAVFSIAAALAQWALHEAALLSPMMQTSSPQLGGAILVAAGAYQLTPFKAACLAHCRSPLGFLMTHWRDGSYGAFHMGVRHGIHCLGCCWALMVILFAVGVMNLVWVALLAGFVLVEKLGRAGLTVSRAAAAMLVVFGLAVMFRAV